MTVKKLFAATAWLLVLTLTLCACDMDALLEGFPLFGTPKEATAETLVPTAPPPMETVAATEAPTEAPTEPEPELYWVCAIGGLNVRSGPDTGYSSVGSLDDGLVIEPVRWSNGWAYIRYPITGWCSGDYLHPLGWYKDVRMPVGQEPEDHSLTGKWIHVTEPVLSGNARRTRVGLYEFRADGTFTHSVANYISYTAGNWALITYETDRPQWVGEYQYDGKVLTLNYMASMDITYNTTTGAAQSREWLSAGYVLETEAVISPDTLSFTVTAGDQIPCYAGFAASADTGSTLYRVPPHRASPMMYARPSGVGFPK